MRQRLTLLLHGYPEEEESLPEEEGRPSPMCLFLVRPTAPCFRLYPV